MAEQIKRNLPLLMIFLIALQFFTALLTYRFIATNVEIAPYQPFGNTTVSEATLNTLSFFAPVVFFTFLFVFLLKKFGLSFFRLILMFLSFMIIFLLNPAYIDIVLTNYFAEPIPIIVAYSTTAVLIALAVYSIVKEKLVLTNVVTFIVIAEMGSLFALALSPPTLFILPVAFLVWDIYAVFFGPLKVLINEIRTKSLAAQQSATKTTEAPKRKYLNLSILIANVGGFSIGSGDLFFYSMLVSAAFIMGGSLLTLLVMAAVNLGVLLTMLLLMRKENRMLPALPIPLIFGLTILALFWYL